MDVRVTEVMALCIYVRAVVCRSEDVTYVKLSKLTARLASIAVKEFVWNGKQTIHKETYELKMDFASVGECFELNIYTMRKWI